MPTHTKRYVVKDYMHKPVFSISKAATLKDAVDAMLQKRTNGLVVVDEKNRLVGILSSWDIISYIVPDYLEKDEHLAPFEGESVFKDRTLELADTPITQFMTRHVHTTKASHSLTEAASLLAQFRIRQLPVVDDDNTLIGYINRTDLKRAIGDILGLSSART